MQKGHDSPKREGKLKPQGYIKRMPIMPRPRARPFCEARPICGPTFSCASEVMPRSGKASWSLESIAGDALGTPHERRSRIPSRSNWITTSPRPIPSSALRASNTVTGSWNRLPADLLLENRYRSSSHRVSRKRRRIRIIESERIVAILRLPRKSNFFFGIKSSIELLQPELINEPSKGCARHDQGRKHGRDDAQGE